MSRTAAILLSRTSRRIAAAFTLGIATAAALAAEFGPALLPYGADTGWPQRPEGRHWGAPSGLAVDPDGTSLWVFERCGGDTCTNSDLAPILKFGPSGTLERSFGAGRFVFPHGMDVDADGNVYVTDAKSDGKRGHQVFKFSPAGELLLSLGRAGVAGEDAQTLNMPSDVADLKEGIRIGSARDGSVHSFIRAPGYPAEDVRVAESVAVDQAGNIFAGENFTMRVLRFPPIPTVEHH